MGFDWGSFTGGIVGTLGAIGAVKYSMHLQEKKEKPNKIKQQVQIIDILIGIFERNWVEINKEPLDTYENAFEKTITIVNTLRQYLTVALDSDRELVSFLLGAIDEFNKTGNDFSQRERSRDELWRFQTAILTVIGFKQSDLRKMKEKLFSEYKYS